MIRGVRRKIRRRTLHDSAIRSEASRLSLTRSFRFLRCFSGFKKKQKILKLQKNMKKYISLILFPYLSAINLFSILSSGSLSNLPKPARILICAIYISVNLVELFFSIKCVLPIVKNTVANKNDPDLLKKIIIIKFIHIPAYIFIFLYGFAMFTLPLGFIISLFCFVADCWSIFFTGFPLTFALLEKYRRKEISKKFTVFHSILSFFFCLDTIDGIYLIRKFRT